MRNISTAVRGHYDDDRYIWVIIIRRFCDSASAARRRNITRKIVLNLGPNYFTKLQNDLDRINLILIFWSKLLLAYPNLLSIVSLDHI
jgi:hypothetical protein